MEKEREREREREREGRVGHLKSEGDRERQCYRKKGRENGKEKDGKLKNSKERGSTDRREKGRWSLKSQERLREGGNKRKTAEEMKWE